jgi:putative transposase
MTSEANDSHADVQHLCLLAGLPRATYYRHLDRRSPETGERKCPR